MSSSMRKNAKKPLREPKVFLNPQNNRKRTRGRNVQHDAATGNKITHSG